MLNFFKGPPLLGVSILNILYLEPRANTSSIFYQISRSLKCIGEKGADLKGYWVLTEGEMCLKV